MADVMFDFSAKTTANSPPSVSEPEPDLDKLFDELNAAHFQNYLPDIKVYWCHKLRVTAGTCRYRRGNPRSIVAIRLSYQLFEKNGWNPKEIRLTMIHEMTHAYLYLRHGFTGHGDLFQKTMDSIVGYKKSHTYHTYDVSGLRNQKRTIVQVICKACGKEYRSRKRMPSKKDINRYRCTDCRGTISFVKKAIDDSDTIFTL